MNITIPFSKDIPFKTKIAEITSISLEQDVSINDSELLGDFIISGEYKNLDVNVDTMPFNFVVPFSVSLDKDIDLETLRYEISDFKYSVKDDDILNIEILFHTEADKVYIKHEEIFERLNDDLVINDVIDELNEEENENIFETTPVSDNRDETISTSLISSNEFEEDYITYHIHMVKINESVESICSDYKIEKDKLLELNEITNISVGDKLLIPINKLDE